MVARLESDAGNPPIGKGLPVEMSSVSRCALFGGRSFTAKNHREPLSQCVVLD